MELHVTDGTVAGTRLVKDIFPGDNLFDPKPSDLTDVNGKMFFVADDGDHGRELWISNGTAQGTRMVRSRPDTRVTPTLMTRAMNGPSGFTFSDRAVISLLDGLEDHGELAI
jgi:ELWxxDGT repeat protein